MSEFKLFEYKDGDKKGTALYSKRDKAIYLYQVVVPKNLVEELKVSAGIILRYHTDAIKQIPVRKEPDEERLKKELFKFLKVKNRK
jgi:hypothetical protein